MTAASLSYPSTSDLWGPDVPLHLSARPGSSVITQALLEAYLSAKKQEKEAEEQRMELHRKLMALHEANAAIEPGPLDLEFKERESRIFAFNKVAEVIGFRAADQLRSQIEPTVIRYVQVVERPTR